MDSFISSNKVDPRFQITFLTNFSSTYCRSGKNRVRCFPQCCDFGHILRGFCGETVKAELKLRSDVDVDSLLIIGEILYSGDQKTISYSRFHPDDGVSETDLRQRCYNGDDSLCLAQIFPNTKQNLEFNSNYQQQSGYNNYIISFKKKPWNVFNQPRMSSSRKLIYTFSITVLRSTTITSIISQDSENSSKIGSKPVLQYLGMELSQTFTLHTSAIYQVSSFTIPTQIKAESAKPNTVKKIKKVEKKFESAPEIESKDISRTKSKKRNHDDDFQRISKSMKIVPNVKESAKLFERDSETKILNDCFPTSMHGERNIKTTTDVENSDADENSTISTDDDFAVEHNAKSNMDFYFPRELGFQSPPSCFSTVFDNDDIGITSFHNNHHTFDKILHLGKKREYSYAAESQLYNQSRSIFE